MTRVVMFKELPDHYVVGKDPEPETYYVNPEHVGAVLPRVTTRNKQPYNYTTLIVQGKYLIVDMPYTAVLLNLGFTT